MHTCDQTKYVNWNEKSNTLNGVLMVFRCLNLTVETDLTVSVNSTETVVDEDYFGIRWSNSERLFKDKTLGTVRHARSKIEDLRKLVRKTGHYAMTTRVISDSKICSVLFLNKSEQDNS